MDAVINAMRWVLLNSSPSPFDYSTCALPFKEPNGILRSMKQLKEIKP
jgi:hypothetical protein